MAVIVDFPRPAPPVLSGPAESLVQAVRAVAAQDVLDLPAAQAVAECSVLLAQLEALTTVALARVADVDRRQLHVLAGAPTVGTWLGSQQTSLDRGQVALARRLPGLPVVAAELAAQRLSVSTAQRLAAALSKLRRHVDRPDGLIDGQDGQQVVTAVVVDGVRQLICEAHGGLADDSALLASVIAELAQIAGRSASWPGWKRASCCSPSTSNPGCWPRGCPGWSMRCYRTSWNAGASKLTPTAGSACAGTTTAPVG